MNEVLEAALDYIGAGWKVFPIHGIVSGECTCGVLSCKDAGKHPLVRNGVKEATGDKQQIEAWFGDDQPRRNIAIATGAVSGITVIDIDMGIGKFGAESWAEAIAGHGEPDTLMARTGGGGMHVYFRYNSAVKTASNVLGKHVDARNDGGYVVAPPSLHRSGGRYLWEDEGTPPLDLPAHLAVRKETRGRPKKGDLARSKYTLPEVKRMLGFVPADDRDMWRNVGIILGREFHRTDEAWSVYREWSETFQGQKGRNHDEIMREAFFDLSTAGGDKQLSMGSIVKAAQDNGWAPATGEVPIDNFIYFGPGNNYIYRPTITHWVAGAVDAAVSPVNEAGKVTPASEWLKKNSLVTSMACDPGIEGELRKGFDVRNGELVAQEGACVFNSYRRSSLPLGDAKLASPFLEHCERVFPREGDAKQFIDYMAHRVQRPEVKPRFALLIAGGQGVGKDTAIEFCCPAIGSWNVANVEPSAFESSFNEFAQATLVRISEAANLHEMSKWAFNERTKVLIAGSPDVVEVNPKYGHKYSVRLHCGVIITTNHILSGIYIPPDDRRYDVIEAATLAEMGLAGDHERRSYFNDLWDWFMNGGMNHVAALLHERDLSAFSPTNGQRKTAAHANVVQIGMEGDSWLDDVVEAMGRPEWLKASDVVARAVANGEKEFDVRRKLGNAIGRLGYHAYRCTTVADGRWKIGGKKVTIYVRSETGAKDFILNKDSADVNAESF